jgi:soluble P-type ATPase
MLGICKTKAKVPRASCRPSVLPLPCLQHCVLKTVKTALQQMTMLFVNVISTGPNAGDVQALRDDAELRRKQEIHEAEESKNAHIQDLMKKHEKVCSDTQT